MCGGCRSEVGIQAHVLTLKNHPMGGDGYNFARLRDAILSLSEATNWDAAKLEWRLNYIYDVSEPQECLCGHFPIIEVCVLNNQKNGRLAEVGNVCVKRFLGIRSDKIFSCVKRIRNDPSRAPNPETVELLFEQSLISSWERNFCLDTLRKRNLSASQLHKRLEINRKILTNIVRARV
jgi:hypothetical protein